MIEDINKILECIQIGLACVFFVYFSLLLKNKFRVAIGFLAIITFMTAWRCIVHINSSRYCCSYILIAIVALAISFKSQCIGDHKTIAKFLFLFFMSGCLVYNLIKDFSSYRNIYVLNNLEIAKDRLKNKMVFIPSKENERFYAKEKFVYTYEDIEDLLEEYSLFGKNIYCLTHNTNADAIKTSKGKIKVLSHLYTNKSKRKNDSFIVYENSQTDDIKNTFAFSKSKNMIFNGDIEKQQTQDETRKSTSELISAGCDFYTDKNVRLPQNKALLAISDSFNSLNYPKIYSDDKNPIEGKFSLHILNEADTKWTIYMFNAFDSVKGVFSLTVNNLDNYDCILHILRYDYRKDHPGPIISNGSKHSFLIEKNETRTIYIDERETDFKGTQSIFLISGKKINCLIDNVFYIAS